MPYAKDHWKTHRAHIAQKYKDDDFSYAIHGASMAIKILHELNQPLPELKRLSCLDHGCGTGRITRVLAEAFGMVVGYDPVPECITQADVEGRNMPALPNMRLTSNIQDILGKKFDVIVSINVVEHLNQQDQIEMFHHFRLMAKSGGKLVIWYSIFDNSAVMARTVPGYQPRMDDRVRATPGARINLRSFVYP